MLKFIDINFFLMLVVILIGILYVLTVRKGKNRTIFLTFSICLLALLLAILGFFEEFFKEESPNRILSITCAVFGYALRPFAALLFVLITERRKKIILAALILCGVNLLIYCSAFFLNTPIEKLAFTIVDEGDGLCFSRGPLGYSSHIVSGILVAYILFLIVSNLRGQHRFEAIGNFVCVVFIVLAVILESVTSIQNLLNTTFAICAVFYYLHITSQANKLDALTGLYIRKSYYEDISLMKNKITGVMAIDMNSLKELNDTKGHAEGDKALLIIADALLSSASNNSMYVYRMGGDEFVILSTSKKIETLALTREKIVSAINKTPYSIAIGYANRGKGEEIDSLVSRADALMYEDKAAYYKSSGHERRKASGMKSEE